NETRVRVELLAKIIPSVLPASGRSRYSPRFMRAASTNSARSSGRLRSGMARKSRFGIGHGEEVGTSGRRILAGARGGRQSAVDADAAADTVLHPLTLRSLAARFACRRNVLPLPPSSP